MPRARHGTDRRHRLPQRLPAVPGAADHRQADPAALRRQRRGLGHLPGVLPGGAAAGLCLRPPPGAPRRQPRAEVRAHRAAAGQPGAAADRAGDAVAGPAGGQPGAADPGPAAADHRAAVHAAGHDQPAAAGLARRVRCRRQPVPAVCGVERGLAGRAAGLSVADRAMAAHRHAGHGLVGGLCGLCAGAVRDQPEAVCFCARRIQRRAGVRGRRAHVAAHVGLVRDGGAGQLRAGGTDQPPDAEHPVLPDDVGAAACGLPAQLHAVLRWRPLVPAARLPRRGAAGAGGHVRVAAAGAAGQEHRLAHRHLPARAVRRLHVLPWRAGAQPAGGVAADALLPGGVGRRRVRRRAGGARRASRAARLFRGRDRPGAAGRSRAVADLGPGWPVDGRGGAGAAGHRRHRGGAGERVAQRGHCHQPQLLWRGARPRVRPRRSAAAGARADPRPGDAWPAVPGAAAAAPADQLLHRDLGRRPAAA